MSPFTGLVNFVSTVAYLFCLNLSAVFSQPGNGLIERERIVYLDNGKSSKECTKQEQHRLGFVSPLPWQERVLFFQQSTTNLEKLFQGYLSQYCAKILSSPMSGKSADDTFCLCLWQYSGLG